MVETFSFQYKTAYKASVSFNTAVDEAYSGKEQRRNLWTNPRRKWVLEFDKNETDANSIIDFFEARKGRYESFYWTWQATHGTTSKAMGGDGVQYRVRFENDELNFEHLALGYRTFQITLVEVVS